MRHVFKSIPVAGEVHRADQLPARTSAYSRDSITLGWEDRVKARGRRKSEGGVEFGTALPLGTVLREGDCFVLDELAVVIQVVERMEPVLVVTPRSGAEWGVFGYQIGNSHQPAMFTADAIICPDLPGTEQVLVYHLIPFTREDRPFTPTGRVADHQHLV
jgi:urease accessory protein